MLDRSQPARVILNPWAGKKPLLASNPYTLEDVIRCLEVVGLSYDLIVPESAEVTVLAGGRFWVSPRGTTARHDDEHCADAANPA